MAWSRRHVFTALSAVYLLALTILAAYSLHKIRSHRLPIPTTLGAFTLALPAITGLALESLIGTSSSASTHNARLARFVPKIAGRASLSQYATLTLFVLETVLATLAGTYITPVDNLRCGLDTQWRDLYHQKNSRVIGRIQDAFSCCGLHSTKDMAYPFPAKNIGVDACMKIYDRQRNCFESWKGEERGVAGVLMGVVVGVAVWKLLVMYVQSRSASRSEDSAVATGSGSNDRRALEYSSVEAPYHDVEEAVEENDGLLASRVQPSLLRDDSEHFLTPDRSITS